MTDFDKVLQTMRSAKINLGEILSSCELIDASALDCVTSQLHLRAPVDSYPFYVLLETAGSDAKHDAEKLNRLLERLLAEGIVSDGTVASDATHVKVIFFVSHRVLERF